MKKTITNLLVLVALVLTLPIHAQTVGSLAPNKIRPALNTRLFAEKAKEKGINTSQTVNGPRRVQGDKDAIITEIPATAEVKYYTRSGNYHYYYSSDGYTGAYYNLTQSGIAYIAFDGNDVYIKDPVAGYAPGTWVKGTKNGNTITVPLGQFLMYNSSAGYGLYITMANVTESLTGTNVTTATEITYTIDESSNTISQNGTSSSYTLTVAWSDDDTVYAYGAPGGEYGTVFTLDESYEPPSTDLVELPSGATVENWYADGTGSKTIPTDAKVAFVGSDVYISGIFADFPDSWIKGTLSGTTVTFQGLQFLGAYGTYNIWAVASDEDDNLTKSFTFTYDEEAKTLTLDEGYTLLANAADDRMYYLSSIESLTLYAEKPASLKIDELPYSNNFDDATAQKEFSIINANGDNVTWQVGETGDYVIAYASPNDDWLVSPAIKLEVGKAYHVAFDSKIQSASWPETFEVKAATEATAEALAAGLTVIESQQITSTSYITIENNNFSVSETGYYHIGIHNTSDDKYKQFVDNFLIEEINPNVPVAVTDLVVTPDVEKVEATITFTAPSETTIGDALTGNLSVDIIRDGAVITTLTDVAPGSEQTFVDNSELGLTLGSHTYQVVASNAAGEGAMSEEVTVKILEIVEVPYTANLTQAGCLGVFTVIDDNNDGRTWSFSSGATSYQYHSSNAGDDYLVTSPIRLYAGKNYALIVNAYAASANFPERFEVKLGKEATAAGLSTTILNPTDVNSSTPEDFEGSFSVSEDGIYYVAIHAISDPDMYYLYVNSLKIYQSVTLLDNDSDQPEGLKNSDVLASNEGNEVKVTINDRTLYRDTNWNTLCLPFNVPLDGSILEGAIVRPLDNATVTDKHVSLTFGDAVDEIVAGVPYIIKWEEKGEDIVDPTFVGVTIDSDALQAVSFAGGQVKFIGYYDAFDITADDSDIWYMKSDNTLTHTAKPRTLKAFRTYFQLSEELSSGVNSFSIDFGDGETSTGITEIADSSAPEGYFNLQGVKFDNAPKQKGVYIVNGKKVVVK